ncbi:gliding motility-associated C-terminal domain-containing protein [Mucilaginibacter mali]|uniref:Gliding motility-associated C-terminal domain-containing protein n=1 Tax=Mucilaginibacter mali TaxID=2740462 RepID=A0A7D4TSV7_9SPHI|nr:gliding motility-associated C-terminal domain-containing protein [Mucilaginibacter mali]QKJ28655.1 gliding motility-associated C-terminal domain-containing protein [Mucilaginibacter mali]
MRLRRPFIVIVLLLMGRFAWGQNCPENISFESGTFKNWLCYSESIDPNGNITFHNAVPPDPNRHAILKNTSPQALDPYGNFPVNCPNGSGYSIQLGNASGGHEAERVSYIYTIPANNQDFTLIYYYAVVLQTPNHNPFEQPAFQANLTDLTTGQAIPGSQLGCGNHLFTASASLQGFKVSDIDKNTVYRAWTPVVLHLKGYGGRTIRLDFTTNDCVYKQHFGYAYLDFEDVCDPAYDGLIKGNKVCIGSDSLKLTAPPGFQSYAWYNADDLTTVLGTSPNLEVSPAPAPGTRYALAITPYPDLGCVDTLYTTVKNIDEVFTLKVLPNLSGCKSDGIDLTQASVTAGSSPGMKFEYYTDANGQIFLSDPKRVTETGDYYIRGTNAYGCTAMVPIHLDLYQGPMLNIASHPPICAPATFNLRQLVSSDPGASLSYYSDILLKTAVPDPTKISKTGIYYVKSVAVGVPCTTVEAVSLIISTPPKDPDFDPADPTKVYASCPPLDLNLAIGNVRNGDNADGTFYTFYTDPEGKNIISDPGKIITSGLYYYKGTNIYGCDGPIAKVRVNVYPVPFFKVTDPDPVVYPQTVNLVYTHIPLTFATFTYWKDAACTKPLDDYQSVGLSGTYYIKAINTSGCEVSVPVHVQVNAPPEADLVGPNTFTPNGDGVNDMFKPTTTGVLTVNYLKILNRYGSEVFYTTQLYNQWDGTYNGKPVPPGTYYWMFSAYDIYRKKQVMKSGKITLIR